MTGKLRGIKVVERTGSEDIESTREFTTVYLVQTDNKNDGAAIVLNTPGLPRIGDQYSAGNDFDPNAIVVSVTPRQRESPTEWEVDVVATNDVDQDPASGVENPLLKPAQINYGVTNRITHLDGYYETPATPPVNGQYDQQLETPNGEPIYPPYEFDIDEPVLEIVKCYSLATVPDLTKIQNTVNSVAFQGADPRQLKLTAEARSQWHRQVGNYWWVRFIMRYRFETWDLQVPNRGTYYWDGGIPTDPGSTVNDFKRKVKRAEGRPIVVNLTTDGDILATGTTPTFTRFKIYRELDFNTLGIF